MTKYVLKNLSKFHDYHQSPEDGIVPPFICHVFTKKDKAQAAVIERNDILVRHLHSIGQIGHYMYVSAKTDVGMTELREAMFNCNIREKKEVVRAQKEGRQSIKAAPAGKKRPSKLSSKETPRDKVTPRGKVTPGDK